GDGRAAPPESRGAPRATRHAAPQDPKPGAAPRSVGKPAYHDVNTTPLAARARPSGVAPAGYAPRRTRKVVLAKPPVSIEEWPAEPKIIKRRRCVPARRGAATGPILDRPASTPTKT